jgi:Rps23 Pro-64 3,4-dihydroxylase Tpa1-like proline 4-hydroxylase
MKWTLGRQNTGYKKLKIFQFLNMDCWLLKYEKGDYIPVHTDPVPGRKHWRLNITLKKANEGGNLYIQDVDNKRWRVGGNLVLFRSDIQPHEVSRIISGERLVLTLGIAI